MSQSYKHVITDIDARAHASVYIKTKICKYGYITKAKSNIKADPAKAQMR